MIPHAFEILPSLIAARRDAGHLLAGLDFDGTLAAIVPRPEDATLPVVTRDVIRTLAKRDDTWVAVLSGRSLDDVAERVDVDGIFYAGNHGLEIDGPGVHRVHEQAAATRDVLRRIADLLTAALCDLPGAQVEDKGLTLSVHYRRAQNDATAEQIVRTVTELCRPYGGLALTHGKRVIEVRPDVDWHKGKALRFLRATIAGDGDLPTIFIGDDRTDEDAFQEVGAAGHGIIVADPLPAATHAHAHLRSTSEVADFLARLSAS